MPPDRYAVFGHPIQHSRSPRIHALFAQQTGDFIEYRAQDVPAENFRVALKAFFTSGGKGLNCTIPLKQLAWQVAERKSERAQRARAVNTLAMRKDGSLFGENTDGVGLLRDLMLNLRLELAGCRILLLGAGGASRGVIQPLLEQHPEGLVIANRTPEKAVQLASEFTDLGPVTAKGFDQLMGDRYDLILNATAASLSNGLPLLPEDIVAADGCCYDLAYGSEPTVFVLWGKDHGAAVSVDGIGMLVEQAAEAFYIWRGVRPETKSVIELLEAERNIARLISE